MADDLQTDTVPATIVSDASAAAANVFAMKTPETFMPFVDLTLNRMHRDYGLDRREAGQLILDQLRSKLGTSPSQEADTDETRAAEARYEQRREIVDEFDRIYVG